jgi:uncharacterized protein (TIRG00374 family)
MAEIPLHRISGQAETPPVASPESGNEAGAGGLSLGRQLLRPRTLLSFAVSIGLIVFIFARQDIPFAQVWENIRRANPFLIATAAAAYYFGFYVRTLRWKQVLHNVGFTEENGTKLPSDLRLTRILVLSWFANSILPAKLGDGYRGYLLKRGANVSFYKAMGTILAERIVDVGMLFSLLLLSGLLAFRDQLPENFGMLVIFGATLSALALSALFFLKRLGPWIHRLLPARARPLYARLEEGALLAFRDRLGFILWLTCAVWLLDGVRLWFVATALGQPLSLPLVIFVALAGSLLTTVPFTPAGLGIVEGAVVTVLLWVVHNEALAGSIALLDRTITYWSLLAVGAVTYLLGRDR